MIKIVASGQQSIHRHQTPSHIGPMGLLVPYGPLRPNVTPSIKSEVHDISQARQRTEPQPQDICTQNFAKISPAVPETCSQTDTQTHKRQ